MWGGDRELQLKAAKEAEVHGYTEVATQSSAKSSVEVEDKNTVT